MFALPNWYIAARSEEIDDRPLTRKIVGEEIAIYRSADGAIHALGARCAHRGGNLGNGRVIGRLPRVPHGTAGGTARMAGAPTFHRSVRRENPGLAKVPAYPVHEAQGYVHVWMNPEQAPTWDPPAHEFLDARYHVKNPVRYQRGSFINTVEAACDDSHVYIAHANTIGQGAPAHLPPVTDVRTCAEGRAAEGRLVWPAEAKRRFSGFNAWYQKLLLGLSEDSNTHDRTYRVELSGMVIHTYHKADGNDFVVYAATTPADEQSNWFFAGFVDTNPTDPGLGNVLYWLLRNRASKVFDEDEEMITGALTQDNPGRPPRPISVPADAMGLAFRRLYARQVEAEGSVPAWAVARAPLEAAR